MAEKLSKDLNTNIEINKVDIHPFKKVNLKGVLIEDLNQDTVINSKNISINIADINLSGSNFVNISKVNIDGAKIKLIKPPGQRGFSFKFLLDYFSGEKKSNKKNNFLITGDRIALTNCHLQFIDHRAEAIYYGIDFKDLDLKDINVTLSGLKNKGSNTKIKIEHLSTTEKTGFKINELKANVEIDSNYAQLDSLFIKTELSNIYASTFKFEFDNPNDFEDDFVEKVKMKSDFKEVKLALNELAYFTPFFEGINRYAFLTGNFDGTVQDFKLNNLHVGIDKNTYFKGDLTMKGLPKISQTTFTTNIHEFHSTEYEISQLDIPPFTAHKKLILPKQLNGIGRVWVSGNLAGKFDDFTGNLHANTNLGIIKTDGRYWYNHKSNTSIYSGVINGTNIAGGQMLGVNNLEDINANTNSTFIWNSLGYDASLKGNISSLVYQNYNYQNIKIDGDFNDQFFDGTATIKDPNAQLTFNGKVNYENKIPEFNFKSKITSLNLTQTNLIKDSLTRIICSDLIINGEGDRLDELNGFAIAQNLTYYENGKEFQIKEIELVASPKDSGKILNLTSNLLDATIEGHFKFNDLPKSLEYIVSKTIPVLYENRDSIIIKNQDFHFDALVKNYQPINYLFTPNISFSKNTFIKGDFDSESPSFDVLVKSDSAFINQRKLYDIDGNIEELGNKVSIDINVKKGYITEDLALDNINFKTKIQDNKLLPSITWKAEDNSNFGLIEGDGYWYSLEYFDFLLLPSYARFNNATWRSAEGAQFVIDKKVIDFENFYASNEKNERIAIRGKISKNPTDKLEMLLADFKLENLNDFIGTNKVNYYGNINGSSCLTNIYENPNITSDISITNLRANQEFIGDIDFNTDWKNNIKALQCKGELKRNDKNAFDFIGNYYPFEQENSLDFTCLMDQTPISFVSSYLEDDGISELYGFVSGNVKISGKPEKPLLNGKTFFDNVGFRVDYLNTYYDFTGEILIENEDIYTKDVIEIRDMTDNVAIFNGAIYHDNFTDFDFNVFVEIPERIWVKGYQKELRNFEGAKLKDNKFYCLNTNQTHNSDFFGNVYATGDINIEGYQDEIAITVNTKTSEGTVFTLPLHGSSEVTLEDYIIFKDSSTVIDQEETINLEGIDLDLNIEATPDAELRIIFDEVYGDVMKGKGAGNLSMNINKNNEFELTGKYVIDKGDYLFTMGVLNFENLINKRFQVAPGSSLTWYGDPYNAEIDINAIYKLKASIYDIMSSYSDEEKSRYKNRTDVECYMNLTQSLLQPNINFEIQLPRADETAKTALINLIQTKQELNKQVFSLLILNRFLPPANFVNDEEERSGSGAIGSTASELFSNQVSNWLSQISNNFDVGFNYRPGDNISNDELAVALSTELLDDRLVISSNFGVSTGNEANQNADSFIGDFSVEYKLNKDGTFRVRAFTRTNEYDVTNTQQSTTTQGVGLYYKKEFNKFKDFFKK